MIKLRKTVDATESLMFVIGAVHVANAICSDTNNCVVAQAVESAVGKEADVEVGATVVKVYTDDKVHRYTTPLRLRKAIKHYDQTGKWSLPVGTYKLNPPSPTTRLGARSSRWSRVHKKKTKAGRDVFKGRALPTRRAKRAMNTELINLPNV
jgi:hypothetical protein